MPLTPGTRLGPYEILTPLGAGGMGEVYKARDTRLDRIVAIKISKENFSERFEREARVIAALNHPNICQLYDVGPNYLVMEYVEGSAVAPPDSTRKLLDIAKASHRCSRQEFLSSRRAIQQFFVQSGAKNARSYRINVDAVPCPLDAK